MSSGIEIVFRIGTMRPMGRHAGSKIVRCFNVMEDAYAEGSDGGVLPVPARTLLYACRRLTGLGDTLGTTYFLSGSGHDTSVLDQFLVGNPDLTAEWDILRDARGTFVPPHRGDHVQLGTKEVRDYLATVDEHDIDLGDGMRFTLACPKAGPKDRSAPSSTSRRRASGRSSLRLASRTATTWPSPAARASPTRRPSGCSSTWPRSTACRCWWPTTSTRAASRSPGSWATPSTGSTSPTSGSTGMTSRTTAGSRTPRAARCCCQRRLSP